VPPEEEVRADMSKRCHKIVLNHENKLKQTHEIRLQRMKNNVDYDKKMCMQQPYHSELERSRNKLQERIKEINLRIQTDDAIRKSQPERMVKLGDDGSKEAELPNLKPKKKRSSDSYIVTEAPKSYSPQEADAAIDKERIQEHIHGSSTPPEEEGVDVDRMRRQEESKRMDKIRRSDSDD